MAKTICSNETLCSALLRVGFTIDDLSGCIWNGDSENLEFDNSGRFELNFSYEGEEYSSVTITSKGLLFDDELVAGEPEVVMPVKGQVINLNMNGTTRQYRVLKTEGTQAEVVAMFSPNASCMFRSSATNTYSGGDLDTYLNTTWYGGLTITAKNAIVTKTITQYKYSHNWSVGDETTHASLADYSTKSAKAIGLSRNIYALDVEDIENYFNHTFSRADIWELFFNVRTEPSNIYIWTRSASTTSSGVWAVRADAGFVDSYNAGYTYTARPAFTIDLSKID